MSDTTPTPPGEEPGRAGPPPGRPTPPPAPPPPSSQQWPSGPPPAAPPPQAWSPADPTTPAATDADARQWAMIAHLSALAGLVFGGVLIWLGPLIVYLVKKDEHPFIADQSREALNFNLSVFIYALVSFVLIFAYLIGLLLLPAITIAWLVLTIMAAVRANNGETYRYPLTIKFVS